MAYKLGAWSPADVPYSDLLNTRFPWLFVLFGGYLPAVSEEFLFRMFAIPFLRKLVRWLPAAVVLAGFIWGFGHAGYPKQPFFIRGLEVGIGGVALGLHHAALGHPADADLALLGGRHVQRACCCCVRTACTSSSLARPVRAFSWCRSWWRWWRTGAVAASNLRPAC